MNTTKHQVFGEIIKRGMYDEYLEFATYMYMTQRMSYFNSALVILQRPGAVCVKTENAWMKDYGRTLKPGVTPIVIMKVSGPVAFVYDISDTYGDKIPVRIKNIMRFHETTTPLGKLYNELQTVVRYAGIYYSESPMGTLKYGESSCEYPNSITVDYFGKEKKTYYSIVINSTTSETNKAAAILHELAHILCGHLQCEDKQYMKSMKIPKRNITDKNTMEYEAEKTTEFISRAMGIEYDANEYLKDYDMTNVDKVLSESYILNASQQMIDLMLKAGIDPHLVEDNGE